MKCGEFALYFRRIQVRSATLRSKGVTVTEAKKIVQVLQVSHPRVAVCLAACNGMAFIEEQIDSILKQVHVDIHLFISVDMSTDGTLEFCQSLEKIESRVTLLPPAGRFGGAAKNFFRLIRDVDFSEYDYVSLADQDDIWLHDKLRVAHECMVNGRHAAYSGNVTAFWPDGRELLINKSQSQRKLDFLFEAAGPGCSYVLRAHEASAFKRFLIENWLVVNSVTLHDWLIYAWFRANNMAWFIDGIPKILYRQHGSNQVGANHGLRATYGRLKLMRSGWYRGEIGKIVTLVGQRLLGVPVSDLSRGVVPRLFMIMNATEVRRRLRDRLLLFGVVMLGIY
jgi:rhamnosyltransferase